METGQEAVVTTDPRESGQNLYFNPFKVVKVSSAGSEKLYDHVMLQNFGEKQLKGKKLYYCMSF